MDFQFVSVAEASITTLMKSIDRVILNPIIFFLFAVAMVYFLYGLAQYLLYPGNEEVHKKSKSHMLWGIIGLFIMVAVFGIMRIILNTVGENKIQINSNGDFTVDGTNLEDRNVSNSTKTGQNLFNPTVDVSSDTNAPDLPVATFSTNPFATYKQDPLCWNKALYAKSGTEYNALDLAKSSARKQYLVDNGVSDKDQTKANYPIVFQTKVLYDKKGKAYYTWLDVRAPIKTGTLSNCSLEVLKPAPVLPESSLFSDVVATKEDINLSTTTAKNTITSFTTSPFTKKYVASPMCWRKEIYANSATEYQALQQVKSKSRAEYLSDNGLSDATTPANLPKTYGTFTSYDKATKNYYAWYDSRGPINGGKDSDCNLLEVPEQVSQSTKLNPLQGAYVSDAQYWRVVASGVDTTYIGARSIAIKNALVQIALLKGINDTSSIAYIVLPEEKYYPEDPVTHKFDYWLAVQSPK